MRVRGDTPSERPCDDGAMFRVRTPDERHLSHFLARERTSPLTYAEVGASFDAELPAGYHHVRAGTDLGRGEEVWTRACAGIRTWAAHRGAGITVVPADAPIEEGTTVASITSLGRASTAYRWHSSIPPPCTAC